MIYKTFSASVCEFCHVDEPFSSSQFIHRLFKAMGIYRYAIFLLIYEFTIFDVIEVIRTREHVQELTEGLFLGLTFLTLCVKYANFLLRENELSDLLDCLRVKMCQPRNSTEKLIIEEHSRRGTCVTYKYVVCIILM